MTAGATRAAELDLEALLAAGAGAMRSTLHTTAAYAARPYRLPVPSRAVPGNSRCWAATTVELPAGELELEHVELMCLLPADHEGPCGWEHLEHLEGELGDTRAGWWLAAGGYPHPLELEAGARVPTVLEP